MNQKNWLFGLLVVVTVLFAALLRDFLQPIFWAMILAIFFQPVRRGLLRRLPGRPGVVTLCTLLVIAATVLLPAALIISAVIEQAATVYRGIQDGTWDPGVAMRWIQAELPRVTAMASRLGMDMGRIQQAVSSAALFASSTAGSLAITAGQGLLRFTVLFLLMLYILYFFVRDGEEIVDVVALALPLGQGRERQLFARFTEVCRATIRGSIVIGLVQGALGALIFAILGIQSAIFWGVVMAFTSLVPAVGTALVWGPAALILAAGGDWLRALVLVVFGVGVIALADNLLRPRLVGRDARIPDYLVLLSTLGGVTTLGLSGIIAGPVVAALFLSVWEMYQAESRLQSRAE